MNRPPLRNASVAGLLVIVVSVAAVLGLLLLRPDLFLGSSTVYAPQYNESRFNSIRTGMSTEQVEAIAGPPLRKVPWNQHMGPHDEEMWFYSEGSDELANYWRRWLLFQDGRVVAVIKDFWVD